MATVLGDPRCSRCPLHLRAAHVCLMGRGPVPGKVMLIGEAPGRREDDVGKPFQGAAGRLLDEELDANGISRNDVYITNMARCRPPGNRTPKAKEVDACSYWLQKEYDAVQPKFVLLMGRTALRNSPFHGEKITVVRGQVRERNGVYYMPTYHPAACLPGRDTNKRDKKRPAFNVDIKSFFAMVKAGGPTAAKEKLNIRIVRGADDFNEMVDDLDGEEDISHDNETMGLNQFRKGRDIVTAGFGTERFQWIVPINYPKEDGTNRSPFKTHKSRRMAFQIIEEVLRGKGVITHNGKYDLLWNLVRYGVRLKLKFDTLLGHYVLDENSPHGLKYLVSLYYGIPNYSDVEWEDEWWFTTPLKKLARYHARDLYYTRNLSFILREELAKDFKLKRFYHTILLPAFEMFVQIQYNGLWINPDNYNKARITVADQLGRAASHLHSIAKINWSSPKQVSQLLYQELGFPVVKRTKAGRPSVDGATLLQLSEPPKKPEKIQRYVKREDLNPRVFAGYPDEILWWEGYKHEIPKHLLDFRAATKLRQFIDSWNELQVDGYLHPNYKFLTVTGRLSCEDPNAQQTPREALLRCSVDAPFPYVFVEADHSQVELRTIAMNSGDKAMIEAFRKGEDIHTKSARKVLKAKEITPAERKKAKAVNFGLIYGMGWLKLQRYAREKYGVHFTDAEAKAIRQAFFMEYYKLRSYYRRQERLVRANGWVRHQLGRVRHLPQIYSTEESDQAEAIRLAINAPVQGFASDYNLAGMLDTNETFSPEIVRIVGAVHDSALLWVHVAHLRRVLPKIKRIMEHPPRVKAMGFTPNVPWVVDFKIGAWGVGKEVDLLKWNDWKTFVRDLKDAGQWGKYKQWRETKKD